MFGEGTVFASGLTIISANHNEKDLWHGKPPASKKIIIGRNCWIGANVIILPGVQLNDGVIVGAGSVVTKSFGKNLVIAGNPARALRQRNL